MVTSIKPNTAIADIFMHAEKTAKDEALIGRRTREASTLNALQAKSSKDMTADEAKKVAQDFEGLFLAQMLEAMVPPEDDDSQLFGNQKGDKLYQSMMMDEYAKQIAASGGIGIASHIERELLGINKAPVMPKNYDIPIGAYERTNEQNKEPLEDQKQGDKI